MEPEPLNPEPLIVPKSKTKEYYRDYYHTNVKQYFNCPHCSTTVQGNISKFKKHQQTEKCRRVKELIEQYSKMSLN